MEGEVDGGVGDFFGDEFVGRGTGGDLGELDGGFVADVGAEDVEDEGERSLRRKEEMERRSVEGKRRQ